jgi:hypothetical protein
LDSREAVVAADKYGVAVRDGDKGWPADHKWMQTLIPLSRTIPGHLDHIAHGNRARIKTSGHDKAEVEVDSIRITRDHEANIVPWARVRSRTSKGSKIEVPADSTEIFRVENRADMAKVSKVEVKDHTVRSMDVRTWWHNVDLLPAEAEEARLFKIETAEVSKMQILEYGVEEAEDSTAIIRLPRTGAWITGRDDPAPQVEADKALVCSRDNSYRKIRTK